LKAKLEKFDVLRGVAILSVFLYHALILYQSLYDFPYENGVLAFTTLNTARKFLVIFPFTYGWFGVQLFLVISGFLIHNSYLQSGKSFHFIKFINRRFWRIYPPYLICLLIFFITQLQDKGNLRDLFFHLGLLHNFSDKTIYTINGSYWSLALEFQLYLLYPLFLFLCKKIGINKCILFLFLINISMSFSEIIFSINSFAFTTCFIKSWIIWALGAWYAQQYFEGKVFKCNVYITVFLLIGFYAVIFFRILSHFMYLYVSIFFIYIIYSYLQSGNMRIGKFQTLVSKLGVYSYSFYLLHQPLIRLFHDKVIIIGSNWLLQYVIVSSIGLIIFYFISSASYKWVELKSILIGKKLEGKMISDAA
jgi:peptidoglycan/LPS O-acetylase OafA/YrhL